MSSGKPNLDTKESIMQSGSGGIKKEPADEKMSETNAPSDKNLKSTLKCWICKANGEHRTRACPKHPKNMKNKADASTPGGNTMPLNSIKKLIAENKCLYCGVEGHVIGSCPVKNWGKGPEAESASQNQAGPSQGVKMEPMEITEALSSPILTQTISAETKPNQQSLSGLPQIVPGSAVSLAQGDEAKNGGKGLKRNRSPTIIGERMPSYDALLQAEKQAFEALVALEEKPLVLKRERTDSTESAEDATQRPPSPALTEAIQAQVVPEDPQPPPAHAPVRIVLGSTPASAPTISENPNPPRMLSALPPPLSELLLKPPPPNPCADVSALPRKRKRKRRGLKRNRGTRIGGGLRMPRYVPARRLAEKQAALAALKEAAPQLEREEKDPTNTANSATRPIPSPAPKEVISAQIVPKAPQPTPVSAPPRILQVLPQSAAPTRALSAKIVPEAPQPIPAPASPRIRQGPPRSPAPTKVAGSAVSLAQDVEPEKGEKRRELKRNRSPTINGVRMPSYKPALLQAEKQAFEALIALEEKPLVLKRERTDSTESAEDAIQRPPSPALTQAIQAQFVPEDPQPPPAHAPVRIVLGSTSASAPTISAKVPPTNPNPPRTLSALPPELGQWRSEILHKPPSPNPCADASALPRKKKRKRRGQKRNGGTRLGGGLRMPKYVPARRLAEKQAALAALKGDAPQLEREKKNPTNTANSATRPIPSPAPKEVISAQIVPKAPQPTPVPAPPRILQVLPQSAAPTRAVSAKIVPQAPQPTPATASPRIMQGPSPSPAPTNAVREKIVTKAPQPARVPAAPRIMQGLPQSPAPPKAVSAKIVPQAPQPTLATAPPRIVQGLIPSPAPTKALSAKIVPKGPPPTPVPAPPRIMQGQPPFSATAKTVTANISTKSHQLNPAPAPIRKVQGLPPSPAPTKALSAKIVPKSPPPTAVPAPPRIMQGLPPSSAAAKAVSANISTKSHQLNTAPSPIRKVQGPPTSSAPTKAVSAKIVPKSSPPTPVPAPPRIMQDVPPFSATAKVVTSNISTKSHELNPAPAPIRTIQGPPQSTSLTEATSAQIMSTSLQSPLAGAPLRILLGSTPSPAPTKAISEEIAPPSPPPPPLSEPLPEPSSLSPKLCTVATALATKKKKRRGLKRNRGIRIGDTRMPSYIPKRLLEQRAALATLKEEAPELETEQTAAQKAIQKPGQATPSKTTAIGNTTKGKPIPTRNSLQLAKLKKDTEEIAKRQQEIREQKILYTKMLKSQLAMCAPVTQNIIVNPLMSTPVQYPGFPMSMSNAMPSPVPRPPVPVTIVNHLKAAVQIPIPPGQNPVGPARPVNIINQRQPVNINQAAKDQTKQPSDVNMMHHFTNINHYPAGVPRSFLNPLYQEHLNQHKLDQMELMQQEKELIKQQRQIEKTAKKVPLLADPSGQKAESPRNVPTQENSWDADQPRAYSPSDVYGELKNDSGSTEPHEGSESPDPHGQKRLSAFKRLGPVTAPKKPKLTINLKCNMDQAIREVVDETEAEFVEEHTPVHLRNDVTTSTDETVMKYLFFWPWKKTVPVRRTASFKTSKSAMLLEQEQMEELYDKDNIFMQITVTNYPTHWTKEEMFDILLEQVNLIPCFIEFTSHECKFLVVRCKSALMAIHKLGFKLRKENFELNLNISVTLLTQNQIDFVPRLVLRRRLNMAYDGEGKLDLQEFTLKSDLSHFIYFPLRRLSHQTDLIQMQSVVEWERLTELNLSHNRLTSVDGFHLNTTTPHLKILDLSYNHLEKVTVLLRSRNLPLTNISLEGNPLCHDYTDPAEYVKVVRMLFPAIRELDGIKIHLKGDLPTFNKNYCLYGAENIVEKFLETFYPLLEAQPADRLLIDEMYDENALMTVLYRYKFIHRKFRISSSSSQFVDEGVKDVARGAGDITKYINKWPGLKHDPFTFTTDVLFHSDKTTIIKICGILKLISETLAEDEPVIAFSRTTLLHTKDGVEYKILNELLLWDEPTNEYHDSAFQVTRIRSKKLYIDLEFDSAPDEESKEKLIAIFGHLTELDRNASRRCLERKEWDLRSALDNFIQLLKLNDLRSIIFASASPDFPSQPLVPLTQ